jgi:hypothetical protein
MHRKAGDANLDHEALQKAELATSIARARVSHNVDVTLYASITFGIIASHDSLNSSKSFG